MGASDRIGTNSSEATRWSTSGTPTTPGTAGTGVAGNSVAQASLAGQ
ncbi:hypothetical protein [Methylobacterium radiotolerans]|nr:hypothetical protein [Methylobacterium radiotolerans]